MEQPSSITNEPHRFRPLWWYANSLEEIHARYPYVLPALLGYVLWDFSDKSSAVWKLSSIVVAAVAQGLMAYAVVRWFLSRKSIQRSKPWTLVLWIAYCGAATAITFAAGMKWGVIREPDNWLVVECHPLEPRNVETHFHGTYYLLDASPNASGEIDKVEMGSTQKRNLQRRLEETHWNEEKYAFLDYVLLYSISNQGLRVLSDIELPLQISYEKIGGKKQDQGDERYDQKEVPVFIHSLSPGETFSLAIFSTNSHFYSRLKFPDFTSVDNDGTTLPDRLRVNYRSDLHAQSSVVSGPELP